MLQNLRYNLTDKFQDPADINIEWGKPYQMLGPSRIIPLFDLMGLEKWESFLYFIL